MFRINIFALAALVALPACSGLDPVTVARLSALSPLEADPGAIRVVAHVPEGLDLPEGGAALTLSATRGEETDAGRFVLAREGGPGVRSFRVATEDLDTLRALQARIRAWEAEDPDGTSGSLSLSVTACETGDGPDPDATISAGVVLEPDGPERPLLRPQAVSRYEELLIAEAGSGLGPCNAAP